MAKAKLKDLSIEQLKNKERSLKIFIGVFIPFILYFFYSLFQNYLNGEEIDYAVLTIAICTIGGPVTIYPELKAVQKELRSRS